jgi:hypothetical protein
MSVFQFRAPLAVAACACLFASMAVAQAPKPATAAAAGPWAQVPALPTACYSGQDGWSERNDTAVAAVREDMDAQRETNRVIDEQVSRVMSEDPMAMAQAMQQAMLDDPANAQQIIEKMTQAGQQAQTELPAQMEKEKQLEAESKAVVTRYQAALDLAEKPAQARWNAFQKTMGWEVGPGFAMMPDPSWPPSAWQEWAAVQKDRDAAYVATCAQWWSATGEFQAYMKRYKAFLVQERVPYEKKLLDEPRLGQYKLLSVPSAGYRSTTDHDAATDYMKMASSLYGERMSGPLCRKEAACE